MPTILALDTSTAACSAALWRDGAVVAGRFEILHRGHAENLMPMIDTVMAEAGAVPADLALVAVTVGPGAFTGLRLGLAAARGLALALGLPCLGLTTTETMAAALAGAATAGSDADEIIVAALDSKRGDFYVQVFDDAGSPLCPATIAAPETLAETVAAADPGEGRRCVLAGDSQPAVAARLARAGRRVRETDVVQPDARVLAALAAARWHPGDPLPVAPRPLYLRRPDATPAADGGRIKG